MVTKSVISAVFQLYRGITIMGYQYKTGMLIKQLKKTQSTGMV
jgi:hypothetical protein